MKHISFIAFVLLLAVTSCKKEKPELTIEELISTGDVAKIRAKKDQLQKDADQARKDIAALQKEIVKLDPAVVDYALVTAVTSVDTTFSHFVEVQGNVQTRNDVMIYPEYSGVMNRLMVSEGQYISKGALIATIDDGGLNQQIAQQRVQLEFAKTTFERQKRLWEQNIGSEIQYLQAKNNYEALQRGIEAMEQQLKKVNVYAPFSGSVEEIITKQGQVVAPGATPILRLVGLGNLYVEADVPENYLPTVRRGTKVQVEMDAIEKEYNTTVKRINSTINPSSRAFTIEVGVPNSRLVKPNLIANLKINDYTNKNAIMIPSNVVSEDAEGNQFVYIVESENEKGIAKVKKVVVELGKTDDENGLVEIAEGLEGGQRVIQEGAKSLVDGQEVQILDYQVK